jgi:hypothetical protein
MRIKGLRLLLLSIALVLPFLGWSCTRIVLAVKFDNHCTSLIDEANKTGSPAAARAFLWKAEDYLREHNLAHGSTSIFFADQDENLEKFSKFVHGQADDAEYAMNNNRPMKSELDSTFSTTLINPPSGISIYPHNAIFMWWGIMGFVLAVFGLLCFHIYFEN